MSAARPLPVLSLQIRYDREATPERRSEPYNGAVSVSIIGIGVVVIAMGLLSAASLAVSLLLFLVHGRDLQEAVRSRGIDDCASQHQEAVDARAAIEARMNVSVHARPSFSSVCFGLVTSWIPLCVLLLLQSARLPRRLSSCNESVRKKERGEEEEKRERERYLPRKEMVEVRSEFSTEARPCKLEGYGINHPW